MKVNWNDKEWEWNSLDEKLLQVNDWTYDLDLAIEQLSTTDTAIQAGGAMGLWPYQMSKVFNRVYTFEPNPTNFRCLYNNIQGMDNIYATNAGLSKNSGFCNTKIPPSERNNAGAFYTMQSDSGIPQFTLDELSFTGSIDLIQLDVEGRELEILKGGETLIEQHSPVIMLEEKSLPQDHETGHVVGRVEQYLIGIGYVVVHRIHRDIIFKRE